MIIRHIKINKFGRLSNEQIEFRDGLNLIYGPNESGKSTLQGFLLNMLFGMSRSKGKASRTDDFTRFEPVDEPQIYSGSLSFESGGRSFLLRRDFAAGKSRDTLLCTDDGELLSVDDGDLSEILGEISRQTYSNTQSMAQSEQADRGYLLDALRDRYANLAVRGGGGTLSDALGSLQAKRRQLESKSRKTGKEAEEVLQRLSVKMEYARTDISEKQQQLDRIRVFRKASASAGRPKREPKTEQERMPVPRLGIFCIIAAVIAALLAAFLPEIRKESAIAFLIVSAVAVLSFVSAAKRKGRKDKNMPEPRPVKGNAGYEWQADYLRDSIREKEEFLAGLQEQYDQEALKKADADGLQEKIDGLKLAEDTLFEIGREMSAGHERQFRLATEQNYRFLTGQYDQQLAFSGDEISLITEEGRIPFWQCSKGTRDLLEFSMRLAAADLLISEEPMPVLLDDAFVNIDDARLKQALLLLAHKKRQVLIFTCQKREEALLEVLKIPYYAVSWSGNSGRGSRQI